jgi:hypothetical protein
MKLILSRPDEIVDPTSHFSLSPKYVLQEMRRRRHARSFSRERTAPRMVKISRSLGMQVL